MQAGTSFEEFSDWDHYYFWGLTTTPPSQLAFDTGQLGYLQSLAGVEAAIISMAAIEPRYLINKARSSAWVLLYASVLTGDKQGFQIAGSGKAGMYVPADRVHVNFSSHINWPEQLLQEFSYDFGKYHAFVVPFLRHRSLPAPKQFERSMQSPDGSVEVVGVERFDHNQPHQLLAMFHSFSKHVAGQLKPSN